MSKCHLRVDQEEKKPSTSRRYWHWALKILSGREMDTSTRRQKIIFATLPHPTITKMKRLLSASWAIVDATRWSIEIETRPFHARSVDMRVCCRGVEREGLENEKPFSLHRAACPIDAATMVDSYIVKLKTRR